MLSKLGLKQKLMIMTNLSVLMFIFLSFLSIEKIMRMKDNINKIGLKSIPIREHIEGMSDAFHAIPGFLWFSVNQLPSTPEREKSIEKNKETWAIMIREMQDLKQIMTNKEALDKLSAIENDIKNITFLFEKIIEELKKNNKKTDIEVVNYIKLFLIKSSTFLDKAFDDLSNMVKKDDKMIVDDSVHHAEQSQSMMIIISILLSVLYLVIGYWFLSKINLYLLDITNAVGEVSQQVSSASSHLSSSAEKLAIVSQEQASTTEETSASLTEIVGMVDSNVHGAEKSNEHANKVYSMSKETQETMEELRVAMKEILDSNNKIENLVCIIEEIGEKTSIINDIVFKTQLLSFNASVEAERAGDHGRGFSVVAQEVGNLAQVSGKAAGEISAIVKKSIKTATEISEINRVRVERGGALVETTTERTNEVIESLSSILENFSKILVASKEQSKAVNQITIAVNGINQSTQEIASNSQENSSSSEELSSQAKSLIDLVSQLRVLVSGSDNHKETGIKKKKKIKTKAHTKEIKKQQKQESLEDEEIEQIVVSKSTNDSHELNEWDKL